MTSDLYVYSAGSNIQCDEKKERLSGDYQELFRIKQYAPGFDCGIHTVLNATGGVFEEEYAQRQVVIRGAYDGQLGWEAKGLQLKLALGVLMLTLFY